jgi:hypothetical protein
MRRPARMQRPALHPLCTGSLTNDFGGPGGLVDEGHLHF